MSLISTGRRAAGLIGALLLASGWIAGPASAQSVRSATTGSSNGGILVTWDRPSYIQGTVGSPGTMQPGIMGYIIYRTDLAEGIPIAVGGTLADVRTFRDYLFVPHDVPNVFSGRLPGGDPGDLETLIDVPGLIAGHRYRYQVQAAYHSTQDWNGDGIPDPIDLLSSIFGPSAPVTAIVANGIVNPAYGDTVDLSNLSVTFETTAGADRYQVVVSRDISFRNRRKLVASAPMSFVPPDRGGPLTGTMFVNASKLSNSKQVFVTVYAWSSQDGNRRPNGRLFPGVQYPVVAVVPIVPPPPGP